MFFEKFINKKSDYFRKISHSAEKLKNGNPLGFLKLQFAAKYQKNLKGNTLETKKIRKKVARCQNKIKKFNIQKPYSLVRFCILL